MYRDDQAAARARLAELERDLAERRAARPTLLRYRDDLILELSRLEHALVWYSNGEKYGFNKLPSKDDLTPAHRAAAPKPDLSAVFQLDAKTVAARAAEIMRELGRSDPKLEQLRVDIEKLEAHCTGLRAGVEAFAAKYPDHPPPPEYRGSWAAIVVPVAVVVGLLLLGTALM